MKRIIAKLAITFTVLVATVALWGCSSSKAVVRDKSYRLPELHKAVHAELLRQQKCNRIIVPQK